MHLQQSAVGDDLRSLRRATAGPRQPIAQPPLECAEESGEDNADALDRVPSDERESLGQFPTDHEADLAAGLLRSYGIAVEIAPGMPWGSRVLELWTSRGDAAQAREILAGVNRGASAEAGPVY